MIIVHMYCTLYTTYNILKLKSLQKYCIIFKKFFSTNSNHQNNLFLSDYDDCKMNVENKQPEFTNK